MATSAGIDDILQRIAQLAAANQAVPGLAEIGRDLAKQKERFEAGIYAGICADAVYHLAPLEVRQAGGELGEAWDALAAFCELIPPDAADHVDRPQTKANDVPKKTFSAGPAKEAHGLLAGACVLLDREVARIDDDGLNTAWQQLLAVITGNV